MKGDKMIEKENTKRNSNRVNANKSDFFDVKHKNRKRNNKTRRGI